jgi:hypothetical protein
LAPLLEVPPLVPMPALSDEVALVDELSPELVVVAMAEGEALIPLETAPVTGADFATAVFAVVDVVGCVSIVAVE